jgi:1,4-alpha-glucan branching enzyme
METPLVPVAFRFPGHPIPTARQVSVIAPFNGWNPGVHPLTRNANGDWETTIFLPSGRAVYCFWVDGTIWLDPRDDSRIPDGRGSEYSVRYVRPNLPRSSSRPA